MNNIWLIGDSFVDESYINHAKQWTSILKEKFKGDNIFLLGKGGLDINTILDTLLINLEQIKEDDLVIIYLPTIWRHRLPLQKKYWDKYEELVGKIIRNKKSHKILNSFMHSNLLLDYREYLESPFSINSVIIRDKKDAEEKFKSLVNPLDFYRMACSCDSQIDRIQKILQSVKDTKQNSNFEFFTWSDDWDSELIQNVDEIKNVIGMYETHNDLWEASNGTEGLEGDHHFSPTMNKKFAHYIINKYPKYFN